MPDFKKIIKNYQAPEVTANFFVLYKDESTWLHGWISMETSLEEFLTLIQGEIEYSWGSDYANMADYIIFHIDLEDNNNLKEIKDNEYYQYVKQLQEIYIVVLHRDCKYRIIENIPPLFEWFIGTL